MDTSSRIQPPRLRGGLKNLQQIAVTTSSQVVAIDAQMRYRWVRVSTSVAISFYFRSDNAGSVDQTLATSAGPSEATLGYQMAANTHEDFMLGGQDNYIVIEGSGSGITQLLGSGPLRTDAVNTGP